jgi:hypothetical protein
VAGDADHMFCLPSVIISSLLHACQPDFHSFVNQAFIRTKKETSFPDIYDRPRSMISFEAGSTALSQLTIIVFYTFQQACELHDNQRFPSGVKECAAANQ